MLSTRLEYLFNCYVQQNCSEKEEEEFMNLLSDSRNEEELKKLLNKLSENTEFESVMPDKAADSILHRILNKDKTPVIPIENSRRTFPLWMRAAAAVVIFLTSLSVFWALKNRSNSMLHSSVTFNSEKPSTILPGGNHAILTLADGSKIVLDSIQNGTISRGSEKINKKGALLIYDDSSFQKNNTEIVYNTLSTPPGGQYQLILPDGSKVWLNASSSIRFPTAFNGNERTVDLTGEAYFEVAHISGTTEGSLEKAKPFYVNVKGMQVEVLGTHFDINAYGDDGNIKTSLLEGSVKIKSGQTSGLLKPGEQGILNNENEIKIKKVNMEEVMAWKNGLFQFDGASITTIMSEISRWYNVEVQYKSKVSSRRFEGKISRTAQLSDVLKILELSNIRFKVEGREIIVQ